MTEFSPPTKCHMSHVMCQVSGVRCQVSHVIFFILLFFFLQSGEASRWRVCYQRGLPRLVFIVSLDGIVIVFQLSGMKLVSILGGIVTI